MNAQCESVPAESGYGVAPINLLSRRQASQANPSLRARRGFIRRSIDHIKAYLEVRRMRQIDRDAFRHLSKLDESLLKDIGVSRADVEWAISLPLSQNASDELQQVSRGYKQRA